MVNDMKLIGFNRCAFLWSILEERQDATPLCRIVISEGNGAEKLPETLGTGMGHRSEDPRLVIPLPLLFGLAQQPTTFTPELVQASSHGCTFIFRKCLNINNHIWGRSPDHSTYITRNLGPNAGELSTST